MEENDQEAMRDKKPVDTPEPGVFSFLFKLGKVGGCSSVGRKCNLVKHCMVAFRWYSLLHSTLIHVF